MRVTEYYGLDMNQGEIDFVDVDIINDTPLYLDPRALLELGTEWGDYAISLVQDFFGEVIEAIQSKNEARAKALLIQLREPNETHLGESEGRSQGRALGRESSVDVYDALAESEAVRSGLLTDLEDTALVIPGIDKDIVSDITTNIIRKPLIEYTQRTCRFYNIPMEIADSGPLWDGAARRWRSRLIELPKPNGKLLLVPKTIVRRKLEWDGGEYYNHYILKYLQELEMAAGGALVEVLRSGRRRVTKKSLKAKYGTGKRTSARVTLAHPEILDQYRAAKRLQPSPPLTHEQLAEMDDFQLPDFDVLLARVVDTPAGAADANNYHRRVESLLSAVFYPALTNPVREQQIHHGRKRIDIRYSNGASWGFFQWVGQHFPAANIFVECKNYTRELQNPEIDQLSGRFSPQRGRIGLLLYRGFMDRTDIEQMLRDTAHDDRGWMLALDDDDLSILVQERLSDGYSGAFRSLRAKFDALVMH